MDDERIRFAALTLYKRGPYYQDLLCRLRFHRTEKLLLGPMATSERGVLYYHPRVLEYSLAQMSVLLEHECWHVLENYWERFRRLISPDPIRWNMAADIGVNQRLDKSLFPTPLLLPETFGFSPGLLEEEYYEMLPPSDKGGCGNTASGNDWEEPELEAEGWYMGEVRQIRILVAESIKRCGTVPDGLKLWVDGVLNPQIRWEDRLRPLITDAVETVLGDNDLTWQWPGKMTASSQLAMPGWMDEVVRVAVVIDSSGSMLDSRNKSSLSKAVAETYGILKSLDQPALVAVVDAEVHRLKEVHSATELMSMLYGGGGTNMVAGISSVLSVRDHPNIVVVMTDGHTPWPERKPSKVEVIVCLIGNDVGQAPKWARVVRVE